MKDLTIEIEEKAKRYDEALERAEYGAEGKCVEDFDDSPQNVLNFVFPEAKESEDGRMIKFISNELACLRAVDEKGSDRYKELTNAIAWLKKQDEQKSNPYSGVGFAYNGHTWGMCARDNGVDILLDKQLFKHLEKQCEQKTVESDDTNAKQMFVKALERVEELNSKGYKLTDLGKNSWWEDFKTYCGYTDIQKSIAWSEEDKETIDRIYNFLWKNRKGDTSEIYQQEKAATWLKSLKKRMVSQPKQEWSEEDEIKLKTAQVFIRNISLIGVDGIKEDILDWLKSLKERIQPQPMK